MNSIKYWLNSMKKKTNNYKYIAFIKGIICWIAANISA